MMMGHQNKILTGALLAVCALPATAADFERQVSADPHGAVQIVNVSGQIDVAGWDRSEVSVEARLDAGVERVDVTSEQGRTVVKVVLPSLSFMGGGSADLHVRVPRESKLDVSGVSSRVSVTGVQGDQNLRSVSGGISADIAGDDAEVKTVSGDVHLRGMGKPGRLHASTISGDLRVEHVAGEVEATTVSGSLEAHVDPARSVRVRTTAGNVSFEGRLLSGGRLEAQTLNGELRVRASGAGGYQYEASSFSGHITSCFNVEAERTSRYGPGERLHGTLGAGDAQVSLKSLSGSVNLCDH